MMRSQVSATELTRVYGEGETAVHALRGITTSFPSGQYAAIMGPSGAGKSTLLNLVGCLDRPTSGSYLLDGAEVAGMDDDALSAVRQRKIGFVFQTFHLVPRLTAAENVELPMVFAGIPPVERRERAEQVAPTAGHASSAARRARRAGRRR